MGVPRILPLIPFGLHLVGATLDHFLQRVWYHCFGHQAFVSPQNVCCLMLYIVIISNLITNIDLTFVWMAVYMADLIETPVPNSFGVNSASLALSVCLLFPVAGWLSDKIGRGKIMAIGGLAMAFGAPVCLALIGTGQASTAFIAQVYMG